MKDVQLDMLGKVDPLGLTERQRAVFELLAGHPEGLNAQQVGQVVHFQRGKHPSHSACDWCASDGNAVLVELRQKGLVVQRRQPTRWELTPRGRAELPPPPGTGPGELPEDF